jgi:pimeloyl-ACP methyl ester carboxylesterase
MATTFCLWLLFVTAINAQTNFEDSKQGRMNDYEVIMTESHILGLQIAIVHAAPKVDSNDYAVLLLHGSSFPSALSFGFKMSNYSWIDNLSKNGYDVYALDFLGYGNADRYLEMGRDLSKGEPVGRTLHLYKDVVFA